MKKETIKPTKLILPSTNKTPPLQTAKELVDEAYVQINQVSFLQNFKALIGHYKTYDNSP